MYVYIYCGFVMWMYICMHVLCAVGLYVYTVVCMYVRVSWVCSMCTTYHVHVLCMLYTCTCIYSV